MKMGFDGSPLPLQTGTFDNAQFGGYVVSGTKFTSEICFDNYNCKFIDVYGVDQVSQNNWMFNQDGTYGILGMGPGSFIWEGFVDPELKTSTYSIELARLGIVGDSLGSDLPSTNITFGSANDEAYTGKTNVYMPSNSDYTYAIDSFGFGLVYQTDGADSSEYFFELGNEYPA